MDKNTIIGFALIAALLFGFSWFGQPSAEELEAQRIKDSIENVTKQKAAEQQKIAELQRQAKAVQDAINDTTTLLYSAMTGKAQSVVLQNEKIALTFSTKGAVVEKAVIKGFKDLNDNHDITLFDKNTQKLNFVLTTKDANISTYDLYFNDYTINGNTLTFIAGDRNGKNITLTYTLGKDYLVNCSLKANGMGGNFAPNTSQLDINWQENCKQLEKGFTFENRYASLTYHLKEGGTDYLSETSDEVDIPVEETTDWVAFKNQFFSAVMIAKNDFATNAILTSKQMEKGSGYLKYYEAKLKTFFDPNGNTPTELEFYYGPNDFRLLQDVETESSFGKDLELERLVYLGWPLFRYINRWFTLYIFDFLRAMAIPMGWILIIITLILKAITYPMVKKSYMSSAKMRVLRPKLDEATKQYNKPEDAMKKQQAMMQLYSEYGVSPLSGCLPMLIQMPIWIAMFNFVPNAIQLRGQSFLWINDLSTYDPIVEWNTNIWLIGDHISLTCILFCVANLLYSWLTMRQQRDQMVGQQAEQMKMMQWMMMLMPLMFFFMFNDYSAGLNFYYFISLFFSATIMWVLRKTTNDKKLLAYLEARRAENIKNPKKKLSGLAARLQAMQQQQEELQRKREELRKNFRN